MTVCGTGGWAGPLPGDPDNSVLLSAVSAFGGIDVSWTYPGSNPWAVAHVLLYRATTVDFALALQREVVGGNTFYDKIDDALTYYYWIQIISINGTPGAVIGPASATAKPLIQDLLAQLAGQIDSGSLANALKTDIDGITILSNNLATEIFDRQTGETSLSNALIQVDAGVANANTFITNEIASRVTADEAFALDLSVVAATAGDAAAAIVNIETAKIGYSALDDGFSTPYDGDGATIVYAVVAYPTVDYPDYAVDRTRIIDKLGVTLWNLTPAGILAPCVWLAGMPMATAIKRVAVVGPDGTGAALETAFVAQKDLNNAFKAQYTAQINANGLVGGFGIYGDPTGIEAGFDVDKFWVGRTTDKFKPFIIANDPISGLPTVYINEAVVGQLTANMIDSRGLSIRDVAGNIILSAGAALQSQIAPYTSGADITSANTAAGIAGQGTLATKSSVNLASTEVINKSLANVDATANTKLVGIAAGADVTSANTAAGISGQGALATLSTADFATRVSGATKPANNATVGAIIGTNLSGQMTSANISTWIANLAVNTLQVGYNQITVPVLAYTSGAIAATSQTPVQIQTSTVLTTGQPINIFIGAYAVITHGANAVSNYGYFELRRDGVTQAAWNVGIALGCAMYQAFSAAYLDTPTSGYHTYTIWVSHYGWLADAVTQSHGQVACSARSIMTLEVKR